MARPIASEVVTLGALLRSADLFIIPPFQRNYAWEEKQYCAFWDDLSKTFADDAEDYFLGPAVFKPGGEDARRLTVIDGQQRLITIIILLSALRHHLRMKRSDALAGRIEAEYLGSKNPEQGDLQARFSMNAANRNTFQDFIYAFADLKALHERRKGKRSSNTNALLLSCFAYMHKQINNARVLSNLTPDALFERLLRSIEERVTLISITVRDDYNAYVLFETLNERGLELSQFDLLKNHLLTTARPHTGQALAAWVEMERNLQDQSIASFMRQHWASRGKLVEERALFAELKGGIGGSRDALIYLDDLARASKHYAALSDPGHIYWRELNAGAPGELAPLVRALRSLGVQQPLVVLLAALEACDAGHAPPAQFGPLLRMLIAFTMRYSTICSRPPNRLAAAYAKIASFIRREKNLGPQAIFDIFLAGLYPHNEEFYAAFRNKTSQDNAVCRYILAKLNDALDPGAPPSDPDTASIDHILPQNPSSEWLRMKRQFKIGFKPYMNRIGNMTLMAPGDNQKLGNVSFSAKREAYLRNDFEITRRAAAATVWTPKEIDKRQKWLATLALEIWRCP